MNMILDYLKKHSERLQLDELNLSGKLEYVVLTPRFRASSHIIFLVFSRGSLNPSLVIKVPRLAGANESVEREAANLAAVQASRTGGYSSIPKLIALEENHNREILIETALSGINMDPKEIRKNREKCIELTCDWLFSLNQSTSRPALQVPDWYESLIDQPIRSFARRIPLNDEESWLLNHTLKATEVLRGMELPIVFEHGDLSHPNILITDQGSIGVLDWEQATPLGLPACDLFFFLAYVGFAKNRSREKGDYLAAFHSTFFAKDAWARPYVSRYARRLQLPIDSLTPLFLLSWFRYLSSLMDRIGSLKDTNEDVPPETVEWMRTNRYYELWHYAVDQSNLLEWT